jgi:protein-tyrosine phosphatase
MFQKLNNVINILRELPYSKIILAHPERYEYVQKDISYLDEFIEMGILLQGNYESILGKYGSKAEKTLKKLLKQEKIDLLATDTHKKESTYSRMDKIEKKLKKIVREDYFKDLTSNIPNDILKNI